MNPSVTSYCVPPHALLLVLLCPFFMVPFYLILVLCVFFWSSDLCLDLFYLQSSRIDLSIVVLLSAPCTHHLILSLNPLLPQFVQDFHHFLELCVPRQSAVS